MSTTLYNGIELPAEWPPNNQSPKSSTPMRVPYLEEPPAVIPIDGGRQLFVDDFLIERCEMTRVHHTPAKHPGNPVFYPTTEWERNAEMPPCTVAKCGGLWFDERERLFKMWYMASYLGWMCYATSKDGLHWERPELDVVPGTNQVLPPHLHPDSGTVWLDQKADGLDRYSFMMREPDPPGVGRTPALMMRSADGIHWTDPVPSGPMDDRSTLFHNPFRQKWVQSIRVWVEPRRRSREYWEGDSFLESAKWGTEANDHAPFWCGADALDLGGEESPQLYNLDAAPYESLMIGFHQILKGPENGLGEQTGLPKLTELTLGTSRDGYHWHRPVRTPFIGADRRRGSWEYGYVESTGGICLVHGDELWFYYSAYAGDTSRAPSPTWYVNGTYANGAMGLAKLRRDGFTSLRPHKMGAKVQTRPVTFSGDRLFVNANTVGSVLQAEVQDEAGKPIEGFSFADSAGFMGNSTCAELGWKNGASIGQLAGRPVRLQFRMDRGDFYAFWVTSDANGESGGYHAGGLVG